jgi:heme-degrading monooxygenase HmoA
VILEVATLDVRAGDEAAFEESFRAASPIIASTPGYRSHELHRCLESRSKYLLLVQWETVEAHTVGFRGSPQYEQWKRLLHRYYDPFPTVEHFERVPLTDGGPALP